LENLLIFLKLFISLVLVAFYGKRKNEETCWVPSFGGIAKEKYKN
jgi:hypothetical protein